MNLNKRRVSVAVLSFVFLSFVALAAAVNFDMLLTRQHGSSTVNPVVLLSYVFRSQRGLTLWLLLTGLDAVGVCYALLGKQYLDYHSKMYEVVPGFEIPTPEGQGQYGTAWWLAKDRYGEVFGSVSLGSGIDISKELTERYAEERREMDGAFDEGD